MKSKDHGLWICNDNALEIVITLVHFSIRPLKMIAMHFIDKIKYFLILNLPIS